MVSRSFPVSLFVSCNNEASSGNIWYIELEPEHKIGTYNPIQQQKQIITESEEFISDAGLSPSGKQLAFTTATTNEDFQMWVINSDGTNLKRIEMFSEEPGFVWLNENLLVLATLWDDWADHPNDAYKWKRYDILTDRLRPLVAQGVGYYQWSRNHSAFQEIARYERTSYLGLGSLQLEGDTLKQKTQIELDPPKIPKYAGARRYLSWTTNGQAIAFSGKGSDNNMEIFLATDYGRTVWQITDFQKNYGLSSGGNISLSPGWLMDCLLDGFGIPKNIGAAGRRTDWVAEC